MGEPPARPYNFPTIMKSISYGRHSHYFLGTSKILHFACVDIVGAALALSSGVNQQRT